MYEDAQYEYYRRSYEDWKLEEAGKGLIEKSIELADKSMDETFEKHLNECKEIFEIIEKYTKLIEINYNNFEDVECFYSKLNEICDTLYDIFVLITTSKYKTSRILLRKWLELVLSLFILIQKEKMKKSIFLLGMKFQQKIKNS